MPAFITPVDVTPGTGGSWQPVDVSAHVPVGTTGVMLHFVNTDSNIRQFGARKNGSTDSRSSTMFASSHVWACIGVDANRVLEIFLSSLTFQSVTLTGHFGSEAVFFDNAIDVSTGTTGSFVEVTDLPALSGSDTAIGVFLEMVSSAGGTLGLRKKGSTDSRLSAIQPHSFGLIGVDESEIFEQQISATSVDLFLTGYIKSDAVFNTNATDRSLGSTGAWTDLAALPAGAIGGIYEITGSASATTECGLRANGSSEDIVRTTMHHWLPIECDGSQLVEMNIEHTQVDAWEVGYFTAAAGGDVIAGIKGSALRSGVLTPYAFGPRVI